MKQAIMIAAALTAVSGAAQAQDWDYGESRENGRIALVQYDEGTSIVVQCKDRELKVLIMGLPSMGATWRRFDATRADGRTDQPAWGVGEAPDTMYSAVPGRDARFLRGGGRYELRAHAVDGLPPVTAIFDLPTEWANLDRVLLGCGRPVEDARDRIERITEADFLQQDAPAARPEPARRPTSTTFHAELSCIVLNGVTRQCRLEGARPDVDEETERAVARTAEGKPLSDADPSRVEGRVLYSTIIAARGRS